MSSQEEERVRYDEQWEKMLAEERELVANSHKLKRLMTELKENEGFKSYVERIKEQIKARQSLVFAYPQGGLDNVVQNMYTSGEVAGLQFAIDLPDVVLEFSQMAIDGQNAKDAAKATASPEAKVEKDEY